MKKLIQKAKVYPITSSELEQGDVLIENGKIY
jgi:dihydroorotase-like cyclic amidohydrolase